MATESFERYFLDPVDSDGAFMRPPRRLHCKVEPLIDRATAFKAMEKAVLAAVETVHMAGWVFFPDTPLLDADVRRATAGRTWLDLLAHVAKKSSPATVRIIVTDFDPFFEPRNHRLCWSAIGVLTNLQRRLPSSHRDKIQCIASLHDYFITPGLATFGLFSMKDQIALMIAEYNTMAGTKAAKAFARTPGHWASIQRNTTTKKFVITSAPETRAFIASHHQKFCAVDGRIAFCGGMDLTPLALDTDDHKRRRHPFKRGAFDLSWHDIQARMEGRVVDDIERHFRDRWNLEMLLFLGRIGGFAASAPADAVLPTPSLSPLADLGHRAAKSPGRSVAQALRTISIKKDGQFLPDVQRMDVLESYAAAIATAQHYVYMENQYFRASEIVDQLIARHKKVPDLQVILVIPIAPEELTSRKSADPKALHPIAVQIEQIKRLQKALGANFGVFSLVARAPSTARTFTDAFGSPQIYVHSKICIVDDEYATIGSANVNGRSFRMDSELNIGWFQASDVIKFRLTLWRHLLGSHAAGITRWEPSSFVTRWRAAATANSRQPPATRGGFVILHDNDLLKGIAKKMPLVPEIFINIEDVLPDRAPGDLVERDEARDDRGAAIS